MAISASVAGRDFEIGSPGFFKSFFSTIYLRIERGHWGSRFPTLMHKLYSGRVESVDSPAAILELTRLHQALASESADRVVWDFEQPDQKPPWGQRISSSITTLADYFVTSDGQNLLQVLRDAFTRSEQTGAPLLVQ